MNKNTPLQYLAKESTYTYSTFTLDKNLNTKTKYLIDFQVGIVVSTVYLPEPILELTPEEFLARYNLGLITTTYWHTVSDLFINYLSEIIYNE